MNRRVGLWLSVLGAVLAAAAPASARTLIVDDDAGCRDARFSTIQSAVDAAVSGDTVEVCDGVYREQVTVSGDRLKLVSRRPHGAVIKPPATVDGGEILVQLFGSRLQLRGFTISGPLPSKPVPTTSGLRCQYTYAVAILGFGGPPNSSSLIDGNDLQDISCPGRPADEAASGILLQGGTDVTLSRNRVAGYTGESAAVFVALDGDDASASINDNVLVGPRSETFSYGIFLDTGTAAVRSNTITGHGGIGVFNLLMRRAFVLGNRLRDNRYGIFFSGEELDVAEEGGPLSHIERNSVLDSTVDGITNGRFNVLLRDNRSLGSGRFDCFEPFPTRGQWNRNIGVTDSPTNLCRRP